MYVRMNETTTSSHVNNNWNISINHDCKIATEACCVFAFKKWFIATAHLFTCSSVDDDDDARERETSNVCYDWIWLISERLNKRGN